MPKETWDKLTDLYSELQDSMKKSPFRRETEKARLIKMLKVGTLVAGWEFYALHEITFSSPEEKEKTKLITIFPPRQSWHTYSPEPIEMYALGISGILLRQTNFGLADWEIKWLNEPGREPEIWSAEALANAHLNYLDFEKNNFNEIYPTEDFMDVHSDLAVAVKIIQ